MYADGGVKIDLVKQVKSGGKGGEKRKGEMVILMEDKIVEMLNEGDQAGHLRG